MDCINVFTDGGCSGNPGPGGWAFVLINNGSVISTSSGGEALTTNNKMELMAVINAINSCNIIGADKIVINTDSQYVKNGITTWIFNWKKNGWKTASKDPVKNQDLWQELDALASSANITWNWVKGHAGIEYNEMCDTMVKKEMQKYL